MILSADPMFFFIAIYLKVDNKRNKVCEAEAQHTYENKFKNFDPHNI